MKRLKRLRIGWILLLTVIVGITSVSPVAAQQASGEAETLTELLDAFGGDRELLLEAVELDRLVAHYGAAEVHEVLGIPLDDPALDDPKVYFTLDPRYDYADDKVFVTIKKTYSGLDKTYSQEDFPGVEIAEIRYLTSLKDPDGEYPMLNRAQYRQILALTLKNPGKQNVLDAIAVLEENPIVRHASVDYLDAIQTDVVIPYGDANNDGTLAVNDALLLLQHATGSITLEEKELFRAGFTQEPTAADALLVLQIVTGKVALPDNPTGGKWPGDSADGDYVPA